jgi:hypothetical protein
MSSPVLSPASLASLKALLLQVQADPQLFHDDRLDFLAAFVKAFGGSLPPRHAEGPQSDDELINSLRDEECVEADVASQEVDYAAKEPSEKAR